MDSPAAKTFDAADSEGTRASGFSMTTPCSEPMVPAPHTGDAAEENDGGLRNFRLPQRIPRVCSIVT